MPTLESGQRVLFANVDGVHRAMVFDDVGHYLGDIETPQNLSVPRGSVRTFIQAKAAEYGLTATPLRYAGYAFDLNK